MGFLKQNILEELKSSPQSRKQLSKSLGTKPKSISARISELRKKGYKIIIEKGKYKLIEQNKIQNYIKEKSLYERPLSVKDLSKKLELSEEETIRELLPLLKDRKVFQISNEKIMVKRL